MRTQLNNIPRGFIFLLDLVFAALAIFLAYLLRFNFTIPNSDWVLMPYTITAAVVLRGLSFFVLKPYAGIIQYTSTEDGKRIFYTALIGSALFIAIDVFSYLSHKIILFPRTIILIDFLIFVFLCAAFRLAVKIIFIEFNYTDSIRKNVILFGAGEAGLVTKRTLERDMGINYNVIAFVDDNTALTKKKIDGIAIYNANIELEQLFTQFKIHELIISVVNINPTRKKDLIELCFKYNVYVRHIPPMNKWINGELSFNQIRKIDVEDLLERAPIQINVAQIAKSIEHKTILVTGAAGSIGSEIVRQVLKFNPAKIYLLDQAESLLFDIENELLQSTPQSLFEIVIGDIRQAARIKRIFEYAKPHIVFHAAAYKHVPLMENNPSEAILTNIKGTQIIANQCIASSVHKMIMISTDKAVNPTNVMGATKRVAEMYVQGLNTNTKNSTQFITTRFGNVLGSNGSVIPLFLKQIANGGPITVTHPEVTRYFMTIPEACQLVLEASAMGNGGEIFLFDMGTQVKILDLAKKIIKLHGLELGKDIQIQYTGLRPGEKLYEELLNDTENTLPTHHPKIVIAKVANPNFNTLQKQITQITSDFEGQNNNILVAQLKEIVPEYKSNNSTFEQLDK